MLDGFRANVPVLQTPSLDPHFAGNDTSRKVSVLPPSARLSDTAFQHLSSHFGALTRTQGFDGGRGCAWDIQTHTNSFTEQRKGVSPVRERPLKLIG
ncbi:hypothetical protein TNIN_91861 [Trichonephila inaurata madagascariensis]|uniref:Uncharacterized protein n=1 Tax=Trichonephila inaurata madagascariensis TaxID=2747483 RepID=A0A8X6WYZ0_9ARAC|nr:hypothetical protein TNIN_91861 [Trichonephila inaurata madagascariensis]